jgi:hypothetical protein
MSGIMVRTAFILFCACLVIFMVVFIRPAYWIIAPAGGLLAYVIANEWASGCKDLGRYEIRKKKEAK